MVTTIQITNTEAVKAVYKQRIYILTVITLILSAILIAAANTEQLENLPTREDGFLTHADLFDCELSPCE